MKFVDFICSDDEILTRHTYKKMVNSLTEVGDVQSVDVKYIRTPSSFTHWFGGEKQFAVKSVEVTSGEIGGKWVDDLFYLIIWNKFAIFLVHLDSEMFFPYQSVT